MPKRSCAPARLVAGAALAVIEELDRRRLLSASLSSGTLTVTGTAADDTITLSRSGGDLVVKVRSQQNSFTNSQVQHINIAAGNGNDKVTIGSGIIGAYVDGGAGNDKIIGGQGNDTLLAGAGRNTLQGGDGDDNLRSSSGRDFLYGEGGNDRLYGNAGDDWLDGGGNVDRLWGGDGNDHIEGGSSVDKLYGGNDADSLYGGSGDDLLSGEAGDDSIDGGDGSDVIYGGDGNDTCNGGPKDDFVWGDNGNDNLHGDGGNDIMAGDGENQFAYVGDALLTYTAGNDSLDGGDGNDWLIGGPQSINITYVNNGADTFTGGAGADILDARGTDDTVTDKSSSDGDRVPQVDSQRQNADPVPPANHIHAHLHIFVRQSNGSMKEVLIPAGIGDFGVPLMPVIHTHAADNVVHMHDSILRPYTIGEFFQNWGISFNSRDFGRNVGAPGYVVFKVNGAVNTEYGAYAMHDGDQMEIDVG